MELNELLVQEEKIEDIARGLVVLVVSGDAAIYYVIDETRGNHRRHTGLANP